MATSGLGEMEPPRYQYKQLEDPRRFIRLLRLPPLSLGGSISPTMRHVDLDTVKGNFNLDTVKEKNDVDTGWDSDPVTTLKKWPPIPVKGKYDAISYTWGPEYPQKAILINGCSLMVRQNIWDFLHHCVTTPFGWKNLKDIWIDSICIDQSNTDEKNHQVSQMSEIYRGAAKVVSWLGNWSVTAPCNDLVRELWSFDQDGLLAEAPDSFAARAFLRSEVSWMERLQRAEFQTLIQCPYWTRLWIVQEICLAGQACIVLGDGVFPTAALLYLIDRYRNYAPIPYEQFATLETLFGTLEARHDHGTGLSLAFLASRFRHSQCSVQLDYIYALLGVANGGEKFKVDYNLLREELFWEAFRFSHLHGFVHESEVNNPVFDDTIWLLEALDLRATDVASSTALHNEVRKKLHDIPLEAVALLLPVTHPARTCSCAKIYHQGKESPYTCVEYHGLGEYEMDGWSEDVLEKLVRSREVITLWHIYRFPESLRILHSRSQIYLAWTTEATQSPESSPSMCAWPPPLMAYVQPLPYNVSQEITPELLLRGVKESCSWYYSSAPSQTELWRTPAIILRCMGDGIPQNKEDVFRRLSEGAKKADEPLAQVWARRNFGTAAALGALSLTIRCSFLAIAELVDFRVGSAEPS